MKLFIVVTVYKEIIQNSNTINSILDNKYLIGKLFSKVELLIYDNSPKPQNYELDLSFHISYYSDINNGGISPAYNYAFNRARLHYDWILFLDQDTELNERYFIELEKAMGKLNTNKEVVSIVPKMFHNEINFSPAHVNWGGIHRSINPKYSGIYKNGELMAIGSGMVLKTSFINSINGFNTIFWLDCLDRWIFNKIYRMNKKCYIIPSKINHELSIMDFEKYMNPNKYLNQIHYEAIFMYRYKTFGENIFFIIRLIRRAINLLIQTKDINYSKVSLKIIYGILYSGFTTQKIINKYGK